MATKERVVTSAGELVREFSHYSDVALAAPVVVTKNGRPRNVLISVRNMSGSSSAISKRSVPLIRRKDFLPISRRRRAVSVENIPPPPEHGSVIRYAYLWADNIATAVKKHVKIVLLLFSHCRCARAMGKPRFSFSP